MTTIYHDERCFAHHLKRTIAIFFSFFPHRCLRSILTPWFIYLSLIIISRVYRLSRTLVALSPCNTGFRQVCYHRYIPFTTIIVFYSFVYLFPILRFPSLLFYHFFIVIIPFLYSSSSPPSPLFLSLSSLVVFSMLVCPPYTLATNYSATSDASTST